MQSSSFGTGPNKQNDNIDIIDPSTRKSAKSIKLNERIIDNLRVEAETVENAVLQRQERVAELKKEVEDLEEEIQYWRSFLSDGGQAAETYVRSVSDSFRT